MSTDALQKEKTVAYGINIKPANRGLLHKNLGVAQGKKIPVDMLQSAKNSSDPAERKRATFAMNARKWKH